MTSETIRVLQLISDLRNSFKKVGSFAELTKEDFFPALWEIKPESVLNCQPPLNFANNSNYEKSFFSGGNPQGLNLKYKFNSTYISLLRYAQLISKSFIIISGDNFLLKESYFGDKVLTDTGLFMKNNLKLNIAGEFRDIPFILYRELERSILVKNKIYLPVYHWHFNYHHWLIECLPPLKFILDSDFLADCQVLLPSELSSFQKESIELLDLPAERILYHDGKPLQISELYFPSFGNFSPAEINWLREKFFKKLNIRTKPEKKIYISRSDASSRRIINENELVSFIIDQGFEIHTLTGMKLSEQIELFSQAKIVIGPNGAGLTNILFSDPDCTLVELMPNDQVNHSLWILSNSLGQKYSYLIGENCLENRDFRISLTKFEKLLNEIKK